MSVRAAHTSQVAVLGAQGRVTSARTRSEVRPGIRLATFGALALYGALKWSTLLSGALPRLLGLLVLAMLLAAGRPPLARHSRLLAAAATVVALVAAFPLAGVPLAWVVHLRIAVTANAIGEGLSALPQVLVPYSGLNHWVDLVMVLGAAVLLFDAALLLAFAPGAMEDLRRAGAALPLVALAAVPTTLVRPAFPYLDGAVLFALLVAFLWGERIGRRRIGAALGVCAVAAIAAMFAASALDRHKPWFNYRALANGLAPSAVDTFDWAQGYGPIDWPRKGRVVLEIQARRPEYWKAENLDAFNGVGWTQGAVTTGDTTPHPSAGTTKRWSETIEVTIRDMKTADVIGAGSSERSSDIPEGPSPGLSPGTWVTGSQLAPGDSYRVRVYDPAPSTAQLDAAGADFSELPPGYLTVQLPPPVGIPQPPTQWAGDTDGTKPELAVPSFHSGGAIQVLVGPGRASGAALIAGSPYASAYRLAQRLAAGATTPYQFVLAVKNYLANGYTYNEDPPRSPYPLESFLFSTHRGYCQQFAGAMALLLRMGGVPARVAVGFTPGRLDTATQRWVVTDYDAHAWIEAWFPHYGWVRFDPTPAADPALGGHTPISSDAASLKTTSLGGRGAKHNGAGTAAKRDRALSHQRGSTHTGLIATELPWLAALAVMALLALVLVATKPLRSAEALVEELEGALRRMGRPLPGGATLTWLERRVRGSSEAAAYVRALRLARFGGGDRLPTPGQRRALRRQLRLGMGPLGLLRVVWALPPRWAVPPTRAHRKQEA